jgi:D-alanine-D-alanine ligase
LSRKFDILFPVLHGEEGEGGKLHKFLSKLGKPIVGTKDYKAMQKAWYKIPFKKFCDKNKILTPKWKTVKSQTDVLKFGFPCVVKTSSGGSSREVFIVKSNEDLNKYKRIFSKYHDLFVERYIAGLEVTVAILNGKVLPILEIVAPKGEWFDYKNKYWGLTQEIPNAPSLDAITRKKVQEISLKIHEYFNLGSYSRTDFMIGKLQTPYALEINTIPGMTQGSLVPKQAKAAGISFNQMIEILISSAK